MTPIESISYLQKERRLTPQTIEEFSIAFCSKEGYLYAPTSFPKQFTQLPSKFFDCLIFPICDIYGSPIAVMSRRMYPTKSKYVNSANDNIFTKGNHLYGLHKSYPYILQQNQAIVVEGLFDFLQLYQSGVKNVVSSMGTALSDTHIALLSRFTENVVMLPDPDKAGVKFGKKGQGLLNNYISGRYIKLPEGLDPDEFIIKNGTERFKQLVNAS